MIERVDYEATEAVEAQLDAFVERRAREAADQERVEELWAESARRDRQRRREENRLAWREFHLHLACNHAALCDRHRAKAADLSEGADETETPPPTEAPSPTVAQSRALFEALAKATPESLQRFERRYGPA